MKLFILVFFGFLNFAFSASGEFGYHEVYPGIQPKFEFTAKKYCETKSSPIEIKKFESTGKHKSIDTGKTETSRVIHLYVSSNQYDCKKHVTKTFHQKMDFPAVEIMTHVYLTTTAPAEVLTSSFLETIADLKKELSQLSDNKKKFKTESQIVNEYASAPITSDNAKEAQTFAESNLINAEKFKKDWNYGNAIHHSNLVLGRVKLFEKKTEDAKKYLELAGKTPGSAQLNSFGPNMTLAKELLEAGEKEAVLKYFDACLKFWDYPTSKSEVDSWKKTISQGKTPDFGAHLVY